MEYTKEEKQMLTGRMYDKCYMELKSIVDECEFFHSDLPKRTYRLTEILKLLERAQEIEKS